MTSFRAKARECLAAARTEMDSGDATRLPYAALRLRMALEALIYERAHAYRHFIDFSDSDTWQPAKIMDALLSADPNAAKGVTLAMGLEETYGVPPPEDDMTVLGTEHVVSLVSIGKRYNALGSFLHLPTIKQLAERGDPKPEPIRKYCEAVASDVEQALSSRLFGVVVFGAADFKCLRCGEQIERAVPLVPHRYVTACPRCNAAYRLDGAAGSPTAVTPAYASIGCRREGCSGKHPLWPDEAKPGTSWNCQECGAPHHLKLVPLLAPEETDGTIAPDVTRPGDPSPTAA